jgi:hypothetical protein
VNKQGQVLKRHNSGLDSLGVGFGCELLNPKFLACLGRLVVLEHWKFIQGDSGRSIDFVRYRPQQFKHNRIMALGASGELLVAKKADFMGEAMLIVADFVNPAMGHIFIRAERSPFRHFVWNGFYKKWHRPLGRHFRTPLLNTMQAVEARQAIFQSLSSHTVRLLTMRK